MQYAGGAKIQQDLITTTSRVRSRIASNWVSLHRVERIKKTNKQPKVTTASLQYLGSFFHTGNTKKTVCPAKLSCTCNMVNSTCLNSPSHSKNNHCPFASCWHVPKTSKIIFKTFSQLPEIKMQLGKTKFKLELLLKTHADVYSSTPKFICCPDNIWDKLILSKNIILIHKVDEMKQHAQQFQVLKHFQRCHQEHYVSHLATFMQET